MEAMSCARLRWLTATRRFGKGRDPARALREAAVGRQLKRTLMRSTGLSIMLEWRAGEPESAMAHLKDFLELFSETPYGWALFQERAVCRAAMTAFQERHPESPFRGLVLSQREPGGPEVAGRPRGQADRRGARTHGARCALSPVKALHRVGRDLPGRSRPPRPGAGCDSGRFLTRVHGQSWRPVARIPIFLCVVAFASGALHDYRTTTRSVR